MKNVWILSVVIIVLTLDEIDGIKAIMPKVKKEWADEIVFVDGGSIDGTIEEASKMGFGRLFLISISSGIITEDELIWVARNQLTFSRCEQFAAFKLGQLVDSGQLVLESRY